MIRVDDGDKPITLKINVVMSESQLNQQRSSIGSINKEFQNNDTSMNDMSQMAPGLRNSMTFSQKFLD